MKDIVLNTQRMKSVIHCGAGSFKKFAPKLAERQLFIVTDSNVDGIYGSLLKETFGKGADFVIEAGEVSKTPQTLLNILKAMLEADMKRTCTVIAFGGGVVGDIAGLAASLYMRGVRLVQIPTSLLAQVDSSVGGKTAVDMGKIKNVIGTFYQPEEVICDPVFLRTLPKRELRCGLGEIIKYGALNRAIYNKITSDISRLSDFGFLENITFDCITHKAEVVKADELDLSGARKSLNLGHTTGHALELRYGTKSHGEYVLAGMYYELYIARKLGICGGQYAKSLENVIISVLGNIPRYTDIGEACGHAIHDKKNTDGNISIIVPVKEGEWTEIKLGLAEYTAFICDCSKALFSQTLKLGVVGKDVSKSVSPKIHGFIAKQLNLNLTYDKISVAVDEFEAKADELLSSYDGLNFTIPYKLSVIPHLKKITGDASAFGAVNTVDCGSLTGDNTDGLGFMLMLKQSGVEVNGKKILLIGAGGAGRSVAKKLSDGGAQVFVYDRNIRNALDLQSEFVRVTALDELQLTPYYAIINASGVGMHNTVGISPVGAELIALCDVAVDLIYNPPQSEFLKLAKTCGKRTVNGLAMLFYQAYYAECIWFGLKPEEKQAEKLFTSFMEEVKI